MAEVAALPELSRLGMGPAEVKGVALAVQGEEGCRFRLSGEGRLVMLPEAEPPDQSAVAQHASEGSAG